MLVANATYGSTLSGGEGNDILWGLAGVDSLSGGSDSLLGGADDDVIRGGGGNDTLNGGTGNDQLVGGTGADVFRFDATGWGYDQIFDFAQGVDRINMAGVGTSFGQLALYVIGANTAVILGADRIDVYGVTTLTQSDFLFA